MSQTENPAHVGKHKFEIAGLGLAPFALIGVSEKAITYPDGTNRAAGTCDYCFNGIRYVFHIRSKDGKVSGVGCNCIEKVGDEGLLKAYKTSPEFRKMQREKRNAKGQAARAAVKSMVEENKAKLAAAPHPYGFTDRQTGLPLTLLDQVMWTINACGNAGIVRYQKTLANLIASLA